MRDLESRRRASERGAANWRTMTVITALIVILGSALAFMSESQGASARNIALGVVIAAAVVQLLLALKGGSGGPAIKRFRLLNDTDDDLDDVEVHVVNRAGTVSLDPVFDISQIAARTCWRPTEQPVTVTAANTVIVAYRITYKIGGFAKGPFDVVCANHPMTNPPPAQTVLHDIEEVLAHRTGTTLRACADYRAGKVNNNGDAAGFGLATNHHIQSITGA